MIDIIHPFRKEIGEAYVPDNWTPEHVMQRLIEAFAILRDLPEKGPGGGTRAWPSYPYEWADLVAQRENINLDPIRPRQRPAASEISKANEALYWPMRYLGDDPILCRAAVSWALGKACEHSERRIARREGMAAHTLRARAERACARIARRLREDQVAVR